ncbi:hypothetical protein [Malaciobacter mytili]|uniref:hypothetical protein n=1 Tax=Malaciobacter mytili TaxID=603050 RepID=UPI0013C4C235|nr:hypothetical protein [Malaciobacter mytili]
MTVKELKELLKNAKDEDIVRVRETDDKWEHPVTEVQEEIGDFILVYEDNE